MNALDVLKYGHSFVHRNIDDLPHNCWNTGGVCGVWSVKDIIAHLTSFEHLLEEVLSSFTGGGATPYMESMANSEQSFNDMQVAQRHSMSPAEVLAEYDETYNRVATLAAKIPTETWRQIGTILWYGPEYSLDDYVVYAFYGHKREHMAQINVYKDNLKAEGKL
jgi:hypothetical protein